MVGAALNVTWMIKWIHTSNVREEREKKVQRDIYTQCNSGHGVVNGTKIVPSVCREN